jgi:predicted RNase H-like HicB family nuclease
MADMTYTVHVTREGDTWLADVPAVAGAHTFARSLEGLTKSVREVVILMDDLLDDAEVQLDFHYDLDDESVVEAERLRRIREDIDRREAELVTKTARVATTLSRAYSVRDTAAMLGVTPGRVSQMTNTTS